MRRISQPSRRKETLSFVLCVAASLLLLVLPDEAQLLLAEQMGKVLIEPYWRVRGFAEDILRVREENAQLAARVAQLELAAAAGERARRDLDRLHASGGLTAGFEGDLLPCEVVARRRGRFATMIKIRSQGMTAWSRYQPVITPAGLLGRIRMISGANTAWVELLTSPDLALGCEIERTGLLGILRARAGRFHLEMVGRDEDVLPGDSIITSGIAEIRDESGELDATRMPRGLPVGTVSTVSSPPDQLFKEIQVQPRASFQYNQTVFVVGAKLVRGGPVDADGDGGPTP
jgi:rod shape-determining protein MreC